MSPKIPFSARRKKMFLVMGALLLANAGVAHILVDQIVFTTSTQNKVLGEETVATEGELVSGNADTPLRADAKQQISIYTVESGDTLSGIAERFHISTNTIRWANELDKKATIRVGQKLVILPITGVQYTVKSGDTLSGIAKKFDANAEEVLSFNDLEDPDELKVGMKLIIPDAEPVTAPSPAKPKQAAVTHSPSTSSVQENTEETDTDTHEGEFVHPVLGGILTQGLHAVNAVDIGAPTGTPVRAVKDGTVIVAKGGGSYNGGFGNFIVIDHGGGAQTLYAHLSKVTVKVGDSVDSGEEIGKVGNTGKSTGPHLHIEYHGTKNPYVGNKKGTRY